MKINDFHSDDIFAEKKPVGIFLKILIGLFWLAQIWTSPYYRKSDFINYNYNEIIMVIDGILQENTLIGGRFAIYELVLLFLGLTLITKYSSWGIRNKFAKRFYFISLIVVAISFFNPNNAFDQVKYLFTNDPRILIVYLFLLYSFLSVSKQYLGILLYTFVYYGLIAAAAQAAVSCVLFITGNGIYYISSATTLPNAEILNVLIVFSALSLSFYFKTGNLKYLLVVLLFHFTVLFADRRTPVYVLIFTDILIFLYYNKISISALLRVLFISTAAAGFYLLVISNDKFDLEYHFLRIFSLFSSSYQGDYINDMGHFEQTTQTFDTLIRNIGRFWGAGMRNSYYYVEGQSGYIHNNFAAVWALYGLHMTLFLFYLAGVYFKHVIVLISESVKGYSFPVKIAVAASSLMILLGDAFTGEYFCKHFSYMSLLCLSITFLLTTEKDEREIIFYLGGSPVKNYNGILPFRKMNI